MKSGYNILLTTGGLTAQFAAFDVPQSIIDLLVQLAVAIFGVLSSKAVIWITKKLQQHLKTNKENAESN